MTQSERLPDSGVIQESEGVCVTYSQRLKPKTQVQVLTQPKRSQLTSAQAVFERQARGSLRFVQ